MTERSVLVVQHEDECPPGMVGDWLVEEGCSLDVRRPYAGEPLPADLSGHDGLLVLGGHMGAEDEADHDWLAPTKALVRDAAAAGVPTLGICLGHQLVASALGGRVVRNSQGAQRGLLPVGWDSDADGDELVAGLVTGLVDGLTSPRRAVHWNDDIVEVLPQGAVRLASAPGGEVQAARFAPTVWGVQCHPEAGLEVVQGWEGTESVHDAVRTAEPELRESWRPLAVRMAALVRARVGARVGS